MRGSMIAVFTLASLGVTQPAAAQRSTGGAPSRGPGWLARVSDVGRLGTVTGAEATEVVTRLAEIERIFSQVDELARPAGFRIEPGFGGIHDEGAGYAVTSRFMLQFHPPLVRVEASDCIEVIVNDRYSGTDVQNMGANEALRDRDGEIRFEWEAGDQIPGVTRVFHGLSATERSTAEVLLTSGGRYPWKPVTRETLLKAVILTIEGENSSQLEAARRAFSRTTYELWVAEAPMRRKTMESILGTLNPAQAAAERKKWEDGERQATEKLKASHAAEQAENARTLAAPTLADNARAGLAVMSPADKIAPAWLDRTVMGEFSFVAPESPRSTRVVRPDPEFFRVRRSRVEAHSITVRFSTSLSCQGDPVQHAVVQAFKKLNWAALARLLEPTRGNSR